MIHAIVSLLTLVMRQNTLYIASSPGHSQILPRSHGEKLGEGLGSKLRHGPEMVDSVSTNRVHVTLIYKDRNLYRFDHPFFPYTSMYLFTAHHAHTK